MDIGCGPGRMAIAIGERFGWSNNYIGFEIRRKDIKFCQSEITTHYPNFQFLHLNVFNSHYNPEGNIDATSLRFPAEDLSIDFCFATSIFTHLFHQETAHYIQEASRITKGTFLSTWFIIDEMFEEGKNLGKPRFLFPHEGSDGELYENELSPEDCVGHKWSDIEKMFRDADFQISGVHRGSWTRMTQGSRHSQDIIVARHNND
jgi:SAM-dependent methyltransferase